MGEKLLMDTSDDIFLVSRKVRRGNQYVQRVEDRGFFGDQGDEGAIFEIEGAMDYFEEGLDHCSVDCDVEVGILRHLDDCSAGDVLLSLLN
jgi:hypothetical protein